MAFKVGWLAKMVNQQKRSIKRNINAIYDNLRLNSRYTLQRDGKAVRRHTEHSTANCGATYADGTFQSILPYFVWSDHSVLSGDSSDADIPRTIPSQHTLTLFPLPLWVPSARCGWH